MSNESDFVWFDLHTTDKEGARAFYSELFGWSIVDRGEGDEVYTSLSNGEQGFGGIELCEDGDEPGWLGYIGVSDVKALVPRLERLGGVTLQAPLKLDGVGTIAIVTDPGGAELALYQGEGEAEHEGDWQPRRSELGDFGWAELAARGLEPVLTYYREGFGWTQGEPSEMPTGTYHMLCQGEQPIAGLYEAAPDAPASWNFYVNVDDVDATVARAEALGARLIVGETLPTVQFAIMMDPQGAMFSVAKMLAE